MKCSMKTIMWGCVGVLGLAVIVAVAGVNIGAALFAFPCLLMMGAMMWMMIGGMGRRSHDGQSDGAAETTPPAKASAVSDLDDRLLTTESPAEILERRFAEGEISVEDYRARREALVDRAAAPNGAARTSR